MATQTKQLIYLRNILSWSFALALGISINCRADDSPVPLFEQSPIDQLAERLYLPKSTRKSPPRDIFSLVGWQANPFRLDGSLVPVTWKVGDKTGFYPDGKLSEHQLGYRDTPGSTAAQAGGDVVGAYLNSQDLPRNPENSKMMITPRFSLASNRKVYPFSKAGKAVRVSLDLQVPTAIDGQKRGSTTYVVASLVFLDKSSGTKISYNGSLFFNGREEPKGKIGFDKFSKSIMVVSPVISGSTFLTVLPDSAMHMSRPWRGWKTFRYSITEQNFRNALLALKSSHPDTQRSESPIDYAFDSFHLNAELHFESAPAELGWSMRNAKVNIISE